jgi:hypothetical protein
MSLASLRIGWTSAVVGECQARSHPHEHQQRTKTILGFAEISCNAHLSITLLINDEAKMQE